MFPDVTMRAQEVSVLGGWVGNDERKKSRTRGIKNASCGKFGAHEIWGVEKGMFVVRVSRPCVLEL